MVRGSDAHGTPVAFIFHNYRILVGTSTIQFLLATIQVAVALRLLIEGFIHTENIPSGAFLYWITPSTRPQVIAKATYVTNVRRISLSISVSIVMCLTDYCG